MFSKDKTMQPGKREVSFKDVENKKKSFEMAGDVVMVMHNFFIEVISSKASFDNVVKKIKGMAGETRVDVNML